MSSRSTPPAAAGAGPTEAEARLARLQPLVGRAQEGDVDAFSALVGELAPALRRFCRTMLGGWQDAEDATQETWLRIWRRLPHLQNRASFVAWSYSVARRVCLDRLRGRQSDRSVPVEDELLDNAAPEHLQPEHVAETRSELDRAWALVASLPLAQREAFVLVSVHGLSYQQAAEVMGTTESTLRGRLSRARARISEAVS